MEHNKNYSYSNKVDLEWKQSFKLKSLVQPPVAMSLQPVIFAG